eukprot:6142085-Prymnesium_polylepis.1
MPAARTASVATLSRPIVQVRCSSSPSRGAPGPLQPLQPRRTPTKPGHGATGTSLGPTSPCPRPS